MSISFSKKSKPYAHWEFLNNENGDCVRVVPERGGLITSWKSNGREILYLDLDRFKDETKSVRGGMPVLFPICGDLPSNNLPLDEGDFFLKQHGFARDMQWKIKFLENLNSFKMHLTDNSDSRTSYPFKFCLEMQVTLLEDALEIKTLITNKGDKVMPFSFGLHPYFLVSDLENVVIDGLPEDSLNHKNMSEVPSQEQLKILHEGIDLLSFPEQTVSLIDSSTGAKIKLHNEPPFNLVVTWTDPPRKMVCLEPWTSPRGSLISGDRMLLLEPGAYQDFKCRFVTN